MKKAFCVLLLAFFSAGAGFPASAVYAGQELSWDECVAEAAKNHPDLVAASEQVNISQAGRKISASGEYPQVTGSLSASTSRPSGGESVESYTAGVNGSQLLFDGKKTINQVKAAEEEIKAAQQNFKFTSTEVRLRLRTAFINLLKAQEMTRISEEIYEIRRSNLELITLRYQSGLEHRGALLTAEANLSDAHYGIVQAQRDLDVARRQLAKEMGRQESAGLNVKGELAVRDTARGSANLVAIAQKNPSFQKILAQKNSADFNLKSTYGSYSPSVSLQAGAQQSGSDVPPRQGEMNVGVSISMPILEGGLRHAQVSQAQATAKQLLANAQSTLDGVVLTLEQTRAQLRDAVDNVDLQYKFLRAAEERSSIAQAQYSIGTITFDSWTIIEDNLVSAKRAYINARTNAMLAEANWKQAKGETLEYEQ